MRLSLILTVVFLSVISSSYAFAKQDKLTTTKKIVRMRLWNYGPGSSYSAEKYESPEMKAIALQEEFQTKFLIEYLLVKKNK